MSLVLQTYLCSICGQVPLFPAPDHAGPVVCDLCAPIVAAQKRSAAEARRARIFGPRSGGVR